MLIWMLFFSLKFFPFFTFHVFFSMRFLCSVLIPVNQMYILFFLNKIFFELCLFPVFFPADPIYTELFLSFLFHMFWIVSILCFLHRRSNISWNWRGGGFVRDSGGGTIKVIKANTKIAQTQISTIKYKVYAHRNYAALWYLQLAICNEFQLYVNGVQI